MTKGDFYTKEIIKRILEEGCFDQNPRPKYADGAPAHTLSVNHGLCTYDLTKGETPLITLRPIATKSSIGELLWIYQDESNDLDLLRDKYGVTWWDEWDIGNRTIGSVYGETVRRHELVKNLLKGLKENPDGRRHIMCLWQEDDFKEKHGLKPCAFMTEWNVRHGKDGVDYLDMCLVQRSSDFLTAGCINQVQYMILQYMIARHLNLTPGRFSWFYNNIQIYDRHLNQAHEMLERESVDCSPKIVLNEEKHDFYDMGVEDVQIVDYPKTLIKTKNPQLKFDLVFNMINITLIAAIGSRYELGKDNQLIWHIPGDMNFFKEHTIHKPIVMGIKTLKSLPKLLPNRKHLVLTHRNLVLPEEVVVFHNLPDLLDYMDTTNQETMVIGGAQVYKELLPYANKMLLTKIDQTAPADAYFPEFDIDEWNEEVLSEHQYETLSYKHLVYTRK